MYIAEQYGYVNQILSERNIKLFREKEQILQHKHEYTFTDIKKPETTIHTIDIAAYPERDLAQLSYTELLSYGFKISMRYNPYVSNTQRFSTEYYLIKLNARARDYGGIPPEHKITIDRNDNKIRLEGANIPKFVGDWHQIRDYYLDSKHLLTRVEKTYETETVYQSDEILSQLSGQIHRAKEIALDIPEIPVLVTEAGDLICIPKEEDPPTIGCLGKRGEGKSLLLHRILDLTHWRWGTSNILLNDTTSETSRWAAPWKKGITFARNSMNELYLHGEHSLPLPIAYLHPEKNPSIKRSEMYHPFKSGVKISLPFRDFVKDFDVILKGHSTWEMGKSGRWLRHIVQNLPTDLKKGNFENLLDYIKQAFSDMESKGEDVPDGVKMKIISILRDLYNANILDISNGIKSTWRAESDIETWEHYPWIILMKYKVIPSLLTLYIRNQSWFPQYLRFINETIITNQNQNPLFKDTVVMEFIDELTGITSKTNPTAASETIEKTFAEGRNMRIGAVYATQNYEKVPDKIATNTHYAFVFRQAGPGLKALKEEFTELRSTGVGSWSTKVMKLKPLECVAFTDNYFIKYTKYGEPEKSSGPFKGTILPPISGHKSPGEKL